jgi:hypothetical protein
MISVRVFHCERGFVFSRLADESILVNTPDPEGGYFWEIKSSGDVTPGSMVSVPVFALTALDESKTRPGRGGATDCVHLEVEKIEDLEAPGDFDLLTVGEQDD